jgi:hypothetical protein
MLGLESFGQCNQSFFRKRLVADWWSMSLSQMIRRPFTEGQLDQPRKCPRLLNTESSIFGASLRKKS